MYKLLIAEDELSTRRWFAKAMDWEGIGFELVAITESGERAWEMLLEHPEIDVVMTDIRMSDMDGLELTAKIRSLPGISREIIILSGYGEFEYARQAMQYGVSDYVLKPVTKQTLTDIFKSAAQRLGERREQAGMLQFANRAKKEKELAAKGEFYRRWLLRKEPHPNAAEEWARLGIREEAQRGPFILMLAEIDDYAEFAETNSDGERELCRFVLFNILEEVAIDYGAADAAMVSDKSCLIVFPVQPEAEPEALSARVGEALQIALKHYMRICDFRLSIGVSGLCPGVSALPEACAQAEKALGNKFFAGKSTVNAYDPSLDIRKECLYPAELEKAVITALKQGHTESGLLDMERFLQSPDRREESSDSIRFAASEMLVQIFRQLRELKSLPIPSKAMESLREDIVSRETLEEIKMKMAEGIRFILDTLALEGMTLSIAAKGVEYMKLKLSRDLSLTEVAEYVGISPSYFSVLFKQEIGSNFIDYMARLRMEKSIELLEKTDLTVARIGDEVGYRSYRYFAKVFKDYYSTTPKQFRERLKQL